MTVEDNLFPNHEDTFLFQDLGNVVIEQNGSRRYDGNSFGGGLQLTLKNSNLSDHAQIHMLIENEKAEGTALTRKAGDWKQTGMQFSNRLQLNGESSVHNIIINAEMVNSSSTKYKDKAGVGQFGAVIYEIISKEIVQKESDLMAHLAYRIDLLNSLRPSWSAQIDAGFNQVNITQYPDEYCAKYSLVDAGLNATKFLYMSRLSFKVSAFADYVTNLKDLELTLPDTGGKKKIVSSYYTPKYQYEAAAYMTAGLSAQAQYRIESKNGNGCYLKLGASYSNCKYNGEYERFNNRNRCSTSISLLF